LDYKKKRKTKLKLEEQRSKKERNCSLDFGPENEHQRKWKTRNLSTDALGKSKPQVMHKNGTLTLISYIWRFGFAKDHQESIMAVQTEDVDI